MKTSGNKRCNLMAKKCLSLGLPVAVGAAIFIVFAVCPSTISADDSGTNFFLKASKSVPRIGRRSEYDNFFLKASKSVPRIGRRRELAPLTEGRDWGALPWFRTADTIPGPSRRSDYYIHEEGQPLSWNDVEKTMEEAPELWKPDLWRKNGQSFPLKDDIDYQHIVRRSTGNKEIDEVRSQAEVQ
ncbi:uncharacterized protein ETH isoform X2 [Periplaneta americana]